MTIRLHRGDLPNLSGYKGSVAVDTEAMGLDPNRDRLCVVQLCPGDGSADVIQIGAGQHKAPNIEKLLADKSILKIFHFARFDMGILAKTFGVMAEPVYCTKIASRLARTYTWHAKSSELMYPNSSSSPTGAPKNLVMRKWPMPQPTSCICMR